MIDPTEGLVVIDVNSGRFRKRMDPEHMALAVNSEAAQEVARQLRLRDLAGSSSLTLLIWKGKPPPGCLKDIEEFS